MSLDSIRARVEAATEGPWEVCDAEQTVRVVDGHHSGEIMYDRSMESGDDWAEAYRVDAEFLAHAHTDISLLLKVAEAAKNRVKCVYPYKASECKGCPDSALCRAIAELEAAE